MNQREIDRLMSIEPAVVEDIELFAISYTDDDGTKVFYEQRLSKSLMVWIAEPMIKYGTKDVQLWRWGGRKWYEESLEYPPNSYLR